MKNYQKYFLIILFLPFLLWANSEKTIVIAGSDFQAKTDAEGAKIVTAILDQIKSAGYKSASHVLYCGDYTVKLNNRTSESETGIAALRQALVGAGLQITNDKIVLVQGNHDPVGVKGMSPSGANDPAHHKYGIFVINEDDYMWLQGRSPSNGNPDVKDDAERVAQTAENLKAYLEQKLKDQYRAPIFVLSHLPLHYSMRTYNDGDGNYAKPIFDVLNSFGKKGLNIIFMYGHNHSNGWDNYLGGAAVCLTRNDKINISLPNDRKKCSREVLAFTYLNAGFTGHYTTTDPNDQSERTLTMMIFEITSQQVVIKRFSADGIFSLKARGVPNTRNHHQEETLKLYQPEPQVLSSPVSIEL